MSKSAIKNAVVDFFTKQLHGKQKFYFFYLKNNLNLNLKKTLFFNSIPLNVRGDLDNVQQILSQYQIIDSCISVDKGLKIGKYYKIMGKNKIKSSSSNITKTQLNKNQESILKNFISNKLGAKNNICKELNSICYIFAIICKQTKKTFCTEHNDEMALKLKNFKSINNKQPKFSCDHKFGSGF
ncbi:hypothetical protein BpHYR1_036468 [Brachionus plicatilis]|uniref:Uncharacterized protein n=1 Tax=Brachionus plicatilis TaxID=10195 RepID=A0A3M7QS19_BRAPC|nr:hypothetical protein BpHYR1_036468 [Brachionus plicatilis]